MSNILEKVRKGMTVLDPSGAEIGTVEFVHLSDEDPSTPGPKPVTAGPSTREERPSFVEFFADAFRTDDVPEPLQERLLRHGFMRLDASGLFSADRYVMPEQIASVSGDQVTLAVGKDALVKRE